MKNNEDSILPCSVIIVNHNRQSAHLSNLLEGISRNIRVPEEIIVVNVNGSEFQCNFENLNVVHVTSVASPNKAANLAAARNLGAERSSCKTLMFLDCACIPSTGFFRDILRISKGKKGVVMGNVRYLLSSVEEGFEFKSLFDNSLLHPYRPIVENLVMAQHYKLFVEPCFCLDERVFFEIGGFDEDLNDNKIGALDLALRLQQFDQPLLMAPCDVFHQPYANYSPPLNRFQEIVRNCRGFYRKWGRWPIEHSLMQFSELNLISWTPYCKSIEVLKMPTNKQMAMAFRPKVTFPV